MNARRADAASAQADFFVDLETTGANQLTDRITEIGIVCVEQGIVERWSTLVNPEMPIPPFIEQLTGISNDMVRDAPLLATLAPALAARLEGGLFIAHNARFDSGFLNSGLAGAGLRLHNDILCTVKLSRKLYPQHAKHSLDSLIIRHELQPQARHRALADADLLWQFWQIIQSEIAPETFTAALAKVLRPHRAP
ncbi:PolC-type DNA polymerase III [Undibacterium arcticum]